MAGRPLREFDKRSFQDLVGLGCSEREICWFFRDEKGRIPTGDTLSRWCKRTYGVNFQEFFRQNGLMALKIKLRKNQFKLSEKSATMAIFLGKNYLGQTDNVKDETEENGLIGELIEIIKEPYDTYKEAETLISDMSDEQDEEDKPS